MRLTNDVKVNYKLNGPHGKISFQIRYNQKSQTKLQSHYLYFIDSRVGAHLYYYRCMPKTNKFLKLNSSCCFLWCLSRLFRHCRTISFDRSNTGDLPDHSSGLWTTLSLRWHSFFPNGDIDFNISSVSMHFFISHINDVALVVCLRKDLHIPEPTEHVVSVRSSRPCRGADNAA